MSSIAERTAKLRPVSPIEERIPVVRRTIPRGGGHAAVWARRREKGGKWNAPAISADGTLRPDTIVIDPETECWNWQMSLNTGLVPQANTLVDGKITHINPRHAVWTKYRTDPEPRRITTSCGNDRCLNPDHLVAGRRPEHRVQQAVNAIRGGGTWKDVQRTNPVSRGPVQRELKKEGISIPRVAHHRAARWVLDADTLTCPPRTSQRDWNIFLASRISTLGDVSKVHGLTRERIRQISTRVLLDVLEAQNS